MVFLFWWSFQGLSFHLGAVLLSLGLITYVEHGMKTLLTSEPLDAQHGCYSALKFLAFKGVGLSDLGALITKTKILSFRFCFY